SVPGGAPASATPTTPASDIDLTGTRVTASESGISRTFAKPATAFPAVAHTGTRATASKRGTSRPFAKPATAFPAVANMPAFVQMMLIRYWETHGRPARLPLLRAGEGALPVEIRL